jgi:hypothetical protein
MINVTEPLQVDVDFLEHFGVKGMKWGVRRERSSGSEEGSSKRSGKEKAVTALKVSAVLGAGLAAAILLKKSGVSVSSLRNGAHATRVAAGKTAANVAANQANQKFASSVARPKGNSPAVTAFNKQMKQMYAEMNASMKAHDNEFNVPIPERLTLQWQD